VQTPVTSPLPAPEPETPVPTYAVKRGDTLYKIALDHGLDYRELASWNAIDNVNLIREGQTLRLAAPGESASSGVMTTPLRTAPPVVSGEGLPAATTAASPLAVPGSRNSDNYKSQPKLVKEPYSEQALRDVQRSAGAAPAPTPPIAVEPAPPPVVARVGAASEPKPATGADEDDKLGWIWPATGKLVTGFSQNPNLKGIDIAGKAGQPVVASASGKVVYSGSGIRGYGKLIIVKHNAAYLSAYAHNREVLVKEGQQVAKGQQIAEMGNTDADQVMLHFEIRRHGTPIDPLKFLPPA
jgi:lipoprotein NlpD